MIRRDVEGGPWLGIRRVAFGPAVDFPRPAGLTLAGGVHLRRASPVPLQVARVERAEATKPPLLILRVELARP